MKLTALFLEKQKSESIKNGSRVLLSNPRNTSQFSSLSRSFDTLLTVRSLRSSKKPKNNAFLRLESERHGC